MPKLKKVNFKTEIVTGECEGCKLTTLLVSIDNTFFRCISCGEDLGLTWNGISKWENKVCDLYFEKDQVDPIDRLEKQIVINQEMDNT